MKIAHDIAFPLVICLMTYPYNVWFSPKVYTAHPGERCRVSAYCWPWAVSGAKSEPDSHKQFVCGDDQGFYMGGSAKYPHMCKGRNMVGHPMFIWILSIGHYHVLFMAAWTSPNMGIWSNCSWWRNNGPKMSRSSTKKVGFLGFFFNTWGEGVTWSWKNETTSKQAAEGVQHGLPAEKNTNINH